MRSLLIHFYRKLAYFNSTLFVYNGNSLLLISSSPKKKLVYTYMYIPVLGLQWYEVVRIFYFKNEFLKLLVNVCPLTTPLTPHNHSPYRDNLGDDLETASVSVFTPCLLSVFSACLLSVLVVGLLSVFTSCFPPNLVCGFS